MTIDISTTILPPAVQTAVVTFCRSIEEVMGDALLSVTMYGSATREDYRPKLSDVNILVVTKHLDIQWL